MNYKQVKASDYVGNQSILDALGIKADAKAAEGSAPAVSTVVAIAYYNLLCRACVHLILKNFHLILSCLW